MVTFARVKMRTLVLTIFIAALPLTGDGLAASSASPPSVTTSNATEIAPFKAVLNGSVNPNGRPTQFYFEYGKSTRYGSRTVTASAGDGTALRTVAALVTGLSSGTWYHFRIVATSDAGTASGVDRTFRTDPPPSVTTGSATNVGSTTVTLNATVNPNGRPANFIFEYGTSRSYGFKTPQASAGASNGPVAVSTNVGALVPGTTYHYRAVASSEAGATLGADRTFTTRRTPSVTTGPAGSITPTSAVVTGEVNPNGRATSWWFEYGTTTSYGIKTAAQNGGAGTTKFPVSMPLTGLSPGTTYHYRLVAKNSGGQTSGADATFVTPGPPRVATGATQGVSTTFANVSGTVNPQGRAATWWFEYGPTTGYGFRTLATSVAAGTADVPVSVKLAGLTPGRRYHYRLVAASDAGQAVGNDSSFGTAPLPRTPKGVVLHCTISGTQSDDVLQGTPRKDVICGLGGNDRIYAAGGDDIVQAGPGDDIVFGGIGNDVIYGGSGRDRLFGQDGRDKLVGGAGANQLFGGSGNDTILGGFLGDTIVGGLGRDMILAGSGNDMIFARDGARDVVRGGYGRDTATLDRRDVRSSIERRR